ncbi:hypothetical protein WR25_21471 [Diploscapter pachys]|uniref:Uncharacterized protein n=1 Tax=Diploscapter pachys TaxID=2018661 RepID=A0A2A2JF30_9BILA|nr:hypothetical protein WR25_21471 [Diploscapter pachys]
MTELVNLGSKQNGADNRLKSVRFINATYRESPTGVGSIGYDSSGDRSKLTTASRIERSAVKKSIVSVCSSKKAVLPGRGRGRDRFLLDWCRCATCRDRTSYILDNAELSDLLTTTEGAEFLDSLAPKQQNELMGMSVFSWCREDLMAGRVCPLADSNSHSTSTSGITHPVPVSAVNNAKATWIFHGRCDPTSTYFDFNKSDHKF